jgi:hypothetical protein
MRMHWLAVVTSVIALHCGGIERTSGHDLCTPGHRDLCECGRAKGFRVCAADGVSYGACMCSSTDPNRRISSGDSDGNPPPLSCTSKASWTAGLAGSADMTPGRPCIDCHQKTMSARAVVYTAAGTIFPGLHDSDDCNGIDGLGTAVSFADENDQELFPRLIVNSVGNFFTDRPLPSRYRVAIISQGRRLAMQGTLSPSTGDCNTCHSASGNAGASGRLVPPFR